MHPLLGTSWGAGEPQKRTCEGLMKAGTPSVKTCATGGNVHGLGQLGFQGQQAGPGPKDVSVSLVTWPVTWGTVHLCISMGRSLLDFKLGLI